MKVFISWSGDRSRLVAELLKDWVKCVLQASQPWISTRDIDRGAVWFTEISQQLNDTAVGIVCLTQENKNRPWILFEAGALAKGLSNRVCTFLIDLQPRDLEQPLAQFNATVPDRDGMWALARTLNDALGPGALDSAILERVFSAYWASFQEDFTRTIAASVPVEAPQERAPNDLLGEILQNTRALGQRVANMERLVQLPRAGFDFISPPAPDQQRRQQLAAALMATPTDGSSGFGLVPPSSAAMRLADLAGLTTAVQLDPVPPKPAKNR